METQRANSSVVAVLILLLVIAGVLYLFAQSQQPVEPGQEPSVKVVGQPIQTDTVAPTTETVKETVEATN